MKLSEAKAALATGQDHLTFRLENGQQIPAHVHVTEVGQVIRSFIDCGGSVRYERFINFQLWSAEDFDHRLLPAKLLSIIQLSEERLGLQDAEVEVEFQGETIGRYDLDVDGDTFVLKNKQTACLAPDACLKPGAAAGTKKKLPLVDLTSISSSGSFCNPESGCC